MTRSSRHLLAAAASVLYAANALAQYVPVPPQPAPAQPAPPKPAPAQPPPVQPVPVQVRVAPAEPRFQFAGFTGYQVNGDVDAYSGKLVLDDAQSFGLSIWAAARPGSKVELLWTYSRVDARFDSFSLSYPSSKTFSVDTHYFQLGGVQSIRRGKLEPFLGATIGAVWYSPERIEAVSGPVSYDLDDTWRFAFTIGGGANIFLGEQLAVRLYARMLAPVFFDGGSFYAGSGGAGVAVSGGIPSVSGDFGVALVLAR